MRKSTKQNQQRALEAIRHNYGVIRPTLKHLKISRTQFYYWLKYDTNFKRQFDEMNVKVMHAIVSKAALKLMDLDPKAIRRIYNKATERKRQTVDE